MKRRRTASWRTKLLVLLLGFALLPAVVIAVMAFDTMDDTMEQTTLEGLSALARAKAEAIDQFMDNRRRDVERMASLVGTDLANLREATPVPEQPAPPAPPLPALDDANAIEPDGTPLPVEAVPDVDASAEIEAPPQTTTDIPPQTKGEHAARAALMQKLSLLLWDQGAFEELLVIAPNGEVVASTFSDHAGRTAAAIEYFDRGRKATYVQPVFLSPITNELTMVIATPIRTADGVDIGVLAARLNLRRFFRLIDDFTGLGRTGETLVGKKLQDEVVFMAPTRHDDRAALSRKITLGQDYESGLQNAARGHSGRGVVTDYRGKQVFAAWDHAPSLEWGVVSKIDYAEATSPSVRIRNRIVLLTLLIFALVLAASLLASRALVRPLRKLKDATDRISKGQFDVELDIRSNDEIGELADSVERMTAAIKFFREHSRRPEDELDDPDEDREESEGSAGS